MPMRCAMRTSVLDSCACSVMLICPPLASLASHLLSDHRSGSEAPDQLLAAFRAPILAALINQDGADNVAVASCDQPAAIDVG